MRTRGELWRCWGGREGEASRFYFFMILCMSLRHLWGYAPSRRLQASCTYHPYSGVFERPFDIPSILQRLGARTGWWKVCVLVFLGALVPCLVRARRRRLSSRGGRGNSKGTEMGGDNEARSGDTCDCVVAARGC